MTLSAAQLNVRNSLIFAYIYAFAVNGVKVRLTVKATVTDGPGKES